VLAWWNATARPRPHLAGGGGARDAGELGEGRHPAVRQAELADRQLRRARPSTVARGALSRGWGAVAVEVESVGD
jgi:hypothetical protein